MWSNEMMWAFKQEAEAVKEGLIDRVLFVSEFQANGFAEMYKGVPSYLTGNYIDPDPCIRGKFDSGLSSKDEPTRLPDHRPPGNEPLTLHPLLCFMVTTLLATPVTATCQSLGGSVRSSETVRTGGFMYAAIVPPGTNSIDCPAASRFRRDALSNNRPPARSIGKRASSFPCSTNKAASHPIPIIAVDGDPVFLESLRAMLQPHTEAVRLAAAFTSVAEALAQIEFIVPDLALIDSLADADLIRKQSPSTAVLLVPCMVAAVSMPRALQFGACGLLQKPFSGEALLRAVISTVRRFAFITETRLNLRELEVLHHLSAFLENKQIAPEIRASEFMVAKILRKIYHKLSVRMRAEAIILWKRLHEP